MSFCVSFLQNVKKGSPGLSFTDIGRALGDRWKKMSGMFLSTFVSFYFPCQPRTNEAFKGLK